MDTLRAHMLKTGALQGIVEDAFKCLVKTLDKSIASHKKWAEGRYDVMDVNLGLHIDGIIIESGLGPATHFSEEKLKAAYARRSELAKQAIDFVQGLGFDKKLELFDKAKKCSLASVVIGAMGGWDDEISKAWNRKLSHGGARKGAGRKPSGRTERVGPFTLSPESVEWLNQQEGSKSAAIDKLIKDQIGD